MTDNFDSKSISHRIASICKTLIDAWKLHSKKRLIITEERRLAVEQLCQDQGVSSTTIISILSHNGDY